ISGMMDPSRVRGFLDIVGGWDPTLTFVMGSALCVMALAWLVQSRMAKPAIAGHFERPDTRLIDGKLITGAVLFGVGWGLAGLCPGPAIGALVVEPLAAGLFVLSMLAGMLIHRTSKL
ncbi:MAG: YeeE/YedE family protein, partial [Erythrobacter sp.]|nr:YeeE/YedE family protein [Erythrobacter sp.]